MNRLWGISVSALMLILSVVALSMGLGGPSAASAPPSPNDPPVPSEPVVVRLYIRDRADLDAVAWRLDIWEVHYDQGYAVAAVKPEQYAWLQNLGYRLEIDEAKTQWQYPLASLDPRYHYFDDDYPNANGLYIVDFLQTISSTYPTLTELIDIGDAWQASHGGHHRDIWVLRVTNEDPAYGDIADKPAFYLFATIHAREVAVPELAIRYIQYLTGGYDGAGGYGQDPDVTWLVNHNVAYILVMQNPDGHRINEANTSSGIGWGWRKNVDDDDGCTGSYDGVDLNRNSSFKWGCCGGSSNYPCDETYRGPGPASEPETQAFQAHFAAVMRDQNGPNGDNELPPAAPITTTGIFISLHSYSDLVLWPYGFDAHSAPNELQLRTIGRKFAFYNGYDPSGDIYTVDGATDDWTYGKFGIASYTFEVGSSGGTCGGFFPPYGCLDGIDGMPRSFWAENRPAFLYAHKIARTPYATAYGPDAVSLAVTPGEAVQGAPVTLTATIADQRCCGDTPQPVAAAEYFVDAPGDDGTGIPLSPTDGGWGGTSEDVQAVVDTWALDKGRHYILVHGRSANGDWGPFTAVFLTVTVLPDSAIVGVVRHAASGAPLDQAAVTLTGGAYNQALTTGPDGRFAFQVLSGTYALHAVAAGYYSTTVSGVQAVAGLTTTQDISLTAIPTGTLTGRVREAGTHLPVSASLTVASAYTTYQTTSDPATGLYALTVLSDVYTVTVIASGHTPSSTVVTVRAGLTTTQDFTLGGQAGLLLVDDDGGAAHERFYHESLIARGYYYQTWDTALYGDPPLAVLQSYPTVLWFSADRHDPGLPSYTLSAEARSALTAYLDGGGHLWMTGYNLNNGNYYTDLFKDRMATNYLGNLSSGLEYTLQGGGPFAGLIALLTDAVYTSTEGFTPDYILPAAGAQGVFTYTLGDWGAGVAYDDGNYQTINLGFGLESITEPAVRTELVDIMDQGLAWLGCTPASVGLWLTKEAASSAAAGDILTYTLILTNNSLIPATEVVLSDALPAHLEPLTASHGGSIQGNVVTWQIASLGVGEAVTRSLTARIGDLADGETLVNAEYAAKAAQNTVLWTSAPVTTSISGVVAPQAGFAVRAPLLAGQSALFTNTTQGARLITYTWDFGDGSPPAGQPLTRLTITHLYEQAGWYTVTLTATNPAGSSVYRQAVAVETRYPVYLPLIRKESH